MRLAQEKFEVILPGKIEGPEPWASAESARQSQANVPSFKGQNAGQVDGSKFNYLPPGMEIEDQCSAEINPMPLSMAGETDVSHDANVGAFKNGFTRQPMSPTEDLYTGEHVDHFYGTVYNDKHEAGFLERNNYLDRE